MKRIGSHKKYLLGTSFIIYFFCKYFSPNWQELGFVRYVDILFCSDMRLLIFQFCTMRTASVKVIRNTNQRANVCSWWRWPKAVSYWIGVDRFCRWFDKPAVLHLKTVVQPLHIGYICWELLFEIKFVLETVHLKKSLHLLINIHLEVFIFQKKGGIIKMEEKWYYRCCTQTSIHLRYSFEVIIWKMKIQSVFLCFFLTESLNVMVFSSRIIKILRIRYDNFTGRE